MEKKCLICGKENSEYVCDKCKNATDIEALCNKIIAYTPLVIDNPNTNQIWDELAKQFDYPGLFREIAMEVAEYLPSPRKEYQKIHCLAGEYTTVSKNKRDLFIEEYHKCVDNEGLSDQENYRIKGLMLAALIMEYRYFEADELASELPDIEGLPWQTISVLADFYIKTRRYDEAEAILSLAMKNANGEKAEIQQYRKLKEDCAKYRSNAENGKKEYMPNPRENKEEAVRNYIEFLSSLGIDVRKPSKTPKPISGEDYPLPVIIDKPDFDSFVAYDFETTGLSSSRDCIIEVGAVKVVNGVVTDSKDLIFSEFVKPFKKSVSDKITEITGITKDDVKDARPMWEVIPDFMAFVGDYTLVGYNNAAFDSRFLARAGRYSNIIIQNPQFDVLKYVRQLRKYGDLDAENTKLATVCELLGVENPAAHRAWADALATARVYMKLMEL